MNPGICFQRLLWRSFIDLRWKSLGLCLVLALGAGCNRPSGKVLGKAPTGDIRNVVAVRAGDTPPQVTVRGEMIEKCPAAGCWFYVQDGTGVIKVDTKLGGFVVTDVPLQSKVTVSGKVVTEGDEVHLEGTGLRY